MREIWKSVPGYKGYYEISSQGRMRSLPRMVKHQHGGMRFFPGKMMSLDRGSRYVLVSLMKHGETRHFQVHQIVADVFHGPCPRGLEVNHKNLKKRDNRYTNLEYMTPKQNTRHASKALGDFRGR